VLEATVVHSVAAPEIAEAAATTEGGDTQNTVDAVDDIFAVAKNKAARKAARKEQGAAEQGTLLEIQAARLKALSEAGRAANRLKGEDSPQPLRFDPEMGMNIYSVKDLKIGAGAGDSALCPFDCKCCF
jgi:hypothetical protein